MVWGKLLRSMDKMDCMDSMDDMDRIKTTQIDLAGKKAQGPRPNAQSRP